MNRLSSISMPIVVFIIVLTLPILGCTSDKQNNQNLLMSANDINPATQPADPIFPVGAVRSDSRVRLILPCTENITGVNIQFTDTKGRSHEVNRKGVNISPSSEDTCHFGEIFRIKKRTGSMHNHGLVIGTYRYRFQIYDSSGNPTAWSSWHSFTLTPNYSSDFTTDDQRWRIVDGNWYVDDIIGDFVAEGNSGDYPWLAKLKPPYADKGGMIYRDATIRFALECFERCEAGMLLSGHASSNTQNAYFYAVTINHRGELEVYTKSRSYKHEPLKKKTWIGPIKVSTVDGKYELRVRYTLGGIKLYVNGSEKGCLQLAGGENGFHPDTAEQGFGLIYMSNDESTDRVAFDSVSLIPDPETWWTKCTNRLP